MKVLVAQDALLSNYEVYQHLLDQQKRSKAKGGRRMPGTLATLVTEVTTYLRTRPSPLETQDKKHAYTPDSMSRLLERLREENFRSELAKGELLTILNIRPASTAVLSTAIEDMEDRFTEDEQTRIVNIIYEVLGHDPAEAVVGDAADVENAVPSIENGN